jgi:hypothetical protein
MAQLTSFFPSSMMSSSEESLTLEVVAARLSYFFEQVHLLHLQTPSHAEHSALGFWDYIVDAKDEILEKLMGYEGRKLKAYKIDLITDYAPGAPNKVVGEVKSFAKQLENFADARGYGDISNLAQSLGGEAAKTLYLLTQS